MAGQRPEPTELFSSWRMTDHAPAGSGDVFDLSTLLEGERFSLDFHNGSGVDFEIQQPADKSRKSLGVLVLRSTAAGMEPHDELRVGGMIVSEHMFTRAAVAIGRSMLYDRRLGRIWSDFRRKSYEERHGEYAIDVLIRSGLVTRTHNIHFLQGSRPEGYQTAPVSGLRFL